MSASKHKGYKSAEPAEEKSLFDVNDDAVSLSYHQTYPMPLNRNSESATSTQHGASVGNPANTQPSTSAYEGLPPQMHHDFHPQSGRSQSWDLLGTRKLGQAYERFDPRNPSEQYLGFADGDLPKSKASAGFCDTVGIGVNVLVLISLFVFTNIS